VNFNVKIREFMEQIKINKKLEGEVVSNKMDKTIKVMIITPTEHPKYKKVINRKRFFMAHSEKKHEIGDKVLDVGSGTSVLGIAASKLGADKIISVDNDEWCYINSKENVERNNVSNINIKHGTIQDVEETEFDLVLANINKNVLMEIKQNLFNKINPSKLLILSGLLVEDLEEIKRQYTQMGLTALEYQQLDEWIVIVFIKA